MTSIGSSQFSEDSFSLLHSDSSFCGEIKNESVYKNMSSQSYSVGNNNLLSFPPVQYDSFRLNTPSNYYSYSNSEYDLFEGSLDSSLVYP